MAQVIVRFWRSAAEGEGREFSEEYGPYDAVQQNTKGVLLSVEDRHPYLTTVIARLSIVGWAPTGEDPRLVHHAWDGYSVYAPESHAVVPLGPLQPRERQRFAGLQQKFRSKYHPALVRSAFDGRPVALVVEVTEDGDEFTIMPMAVLFDDWMESHLQDPSADLGAD